VTYHEWERDGNSSYALQSPHNGHADDLNGCEDMNASDGYMTQVNVVWLVLGRHQQDQHTIEELDHVQEKHTTAETRNERKLCYTNC